MKNLACPFLPRRYTKPVAVLIAQTKSLAISTELGDAIESNMCDSVEIEIRQQREALD